MNLLVRSHRFRGGIKITLSTDSYFGACCKKLGPIRAPWFENNHVMGIPICLYRWIH